MEKTKEELLAEKKEARRLKKLEKYLQSKEYRIRQYLEEFDELRGGSAKKLSVKVWRDQIVKHCITTLESFLDKYENTDLIWSEQVMGSAARTVKGKHPELRPEKEVQDKNDRSHNEVYAKVYNQKTFVRDE